MYVTVTKHNFLPAFVCFSEMASKLNRMINVAPEVSKAIAGSVSNLARSKIVLLESALISHGMPYPKNVEMGLRLEEIVK